MASANSWGAVACHLKVPLTHSKAQARIPPLGIAIGQLSDSVKEFLVSDRQSGGNSLGFPVILKAPSKPAASPK